MENLSVKFMNYGEDLQNGLATISQEGDVPSCRMEDPMSVQSLVSRLVFNDQKRSFKRSRVNGLVDGNPPYRMSKLRDVNRAEATNVNFGTGRAFLESGAGAIYDLFREAPGHFDVRTTYGTGEQTETWSRQISAFADLAMDESESWDYNMQLSDWDMVLHGCGPFCFEDEQVVFPRAFRCGELKVPERTRSDTEYWELAAILCNYWPAQLYKFIRDEEAATKLGWNVEYTKLVIADAMDIRTQQGQLYDWEFYQQQLKNNSFAYYDDDSKVCRVAHVFWQEFSGRITQAIVLANTSAGVAVDYMYRKVGKYKNFKECIHPMYWDHGNGGDHHSVTGLGVKMYGPMEVENRLICNIVDKGFAPKMLFKPTTTESAQKFSLIGNFGDYAVMPANFEWQQTGIAGYIQEGIGLKESLSAWMSSNLSTYRQPVLKTVGNPETATRTRWEASQQSSLNRTQFNRYYEQLDSLYAEMYRRLVNLNSTDERAQKFQQRCKKAGVPVEALQRTEYVRAVRVIGQGSAFMRTEVLNELWATTAPALSEEGRNNLLSDKIASSAGHHAVQRYNPTQAQSKLPSAQHAEAAQWLAGMKQGMSPVITSEQNPVIYATVWLNAGIQAVQSIGQGANPVEVLTFLQAAGPAIGMQISRFANDPTRQAIVKAMEEQWKQLSRAVDQLKAGLARQQQQMARQAQQTQQVMSEQELANYEAQSDIRRKDAVTAARLRQNEIKMRQKLGIDQVTTQADLARQDATTATDIRLKHLEATAKQKGEEQYGQET